MRIAPMKINKIKVTAVITAKTIEDKNRALENGKLMIGWDMFQVVDLKPQPLIQCYRCQE